jgi:hypothetical protein
VRFVHMMRVDAVPVPFRRSGACRLVTVDALGCQVRTFEAGSYGPCGREVSRFEMRQRHEPEENYAFVVCDRHANDSAEDIGTRTAEELRDHVRSLGAEPAF